MAENTYTGTLLDEQNEITLEELTQACSGEIEWVVELVNEGILEPHGADMKKWSFTSVSLLKARTARRLQQDLGINIAGVALALDLMKEIEALQTRLNRLDIQTRRD